MLSADGELVGVGVGLNGGREIPREAVSVI